MKAKLNYNIWVSNKKGEISINLGDRKEGPGREGETSGAGG